MSNDISKLLVGIVLSVLLTNNTSAQTNAWSTQGDSGCSDQYGTFDAFIPGMRGSGSCNRGGFVPDTNVIVVTNLNKTGSGSFDAAMEASCPKVILFGVAGLVLREGRVQANACDNWSVVGSSAPGHFTLAGAVSSSGSLFRPNGGSNWTIGHITLAAGDNGIVNGGITGNSGNRGSMSPGGRSGPNDTGIVYNSNLIWGNDETITCYPQSGSEWTNLLWWQNVIGIPTAGSGVHIVQNTCKSNSIIRNFYVHSLGRMPLVRSDGTFIANNFIANPGYESVQIRPCTGTTGSTDSNVRMSVENNFMVRGKNSSGHAMTSMISTTGCTDLDVYEAGNAVMSASQSISSCANHSCTSGFAGSELTSSKIPSVYPDGYIPERITNDAQGLIDFATQITDFVGAQPTSRLPYIQTKIDQGINMVDGVGDIGGWRSDLGYPSSGSDNNTTTDREGGISAITPASGSYDPTDGSDNPCGEDMPTGSIASAITTSGLTRLHEWAIGCFMDNVMPPGYREDKLQFYGVSGGDGSGTGDVQPNAPGNLIPST